MTLVRTLGTRSLVFILFFTTSGGAFTTESLVVAVGPGLALLMLVLVPLVYSLPEILIVGELASMLPEEGGYYRWVQRAFGRFWAFQNGWLTWVYSLVDMALYPKLFVLYLASFVPGLDERATWLIGIGVIWTATLLNLRGAGRVGQSSVIFGSFILGGFLVLAALAFASATHAPWQPFTARDGAGLPGLGVGLSIALWNYIGWDNASTVQGEVRDASRSYPKALAITLPLVAAGYLLPLLGALAATDWTTWTEGGWPAIARQIGGATAGPALAAWIAVAGMASAIGLFNAMLLSYSRIPFAMATDGLLPAALTRTDRRGTPVVAVIVAASCYTVMLVLPFASLVVADVLLYSLALSLEMAALVRLRRAEPMLRGPFRIPLGTRGVAVLAALPLTVLLLVVALSIHDGEFGVPALLGAAAVVAAGPVAYLAARRRLPPDRPSH